MDAAVLEAGANEPSSRKPSCGAARQHESTSARLEKPGSASRRGVTGLPREAIGRALAWMGIGAMPMPCPRVPPRSQVQGSSTPVVQPSSGQWPVASHALPCLGGPWSDCCRVSACYVAFPSTRACVTLTVPCHPCTTTTITVPHASDVTDCSSHVPDLRAAPPVCAKSYQYS